MKQYTIGLDYGTLSARAVLMELESGACVASSVYPYPHEVMSRQLPDGTKLGVDWALQDPHDFWEALHVIIPAVLADAGVAPEQVIGIGLDTTSCTILPVSADGTPLCQLPQWRSEPHAYIKLWKHHAAQQYADKISALAEDSDLLAPFGQYVSNEFFLPKVAQIAYEAPEVYQTADRIMQVGDWLVWRLCGEESRSYCTAAYKSYYRSDRGDVAPAFLKKIHPSMENLARKQPAAIIYPGDRAGGLTAEAAAWTGLLPGTAVSASIIDAHAAVPGCRISEAGQCLMIIGTSTCEILLSPTYAEIPGISGVVPDGILPGFHAYECGQPCVGDMFAWFVDHCVPADYFAQAQEKGVSIHSLLVEKASALRPGQSGLVALDWWNGVRSTLMDFDLSGLIVGLTINTRPEEIYRALLESTAYGAFHVIKAAEESGVEVDRLWATGGIPAKNPLLMQIYADVCGRDVYAVTEPQTGALGSAILGAAAAQGGFAALPEQLRRYGAVESRVYHPIAENTAVYRELFALYSELYAHFGKESKLMKTLKKIRLDAADRA